ncbi:MAG: hypothetical protein LV473_06245 [Nitrospira sp.]|nr:hypothetical protein [Nitrospira sp.]
MNTSWGTKASHRRKRAIRRTKVRWDLLGLQDPERAMSTMSIDDIRRQIISAASQGLSPDTLSRSDEKAGRPKPHPKASVATRKRGAASQ